MPGREVSVLRRVLAERGEHDAVLEGEAAEGERLEELGRVRAIGLGVGSGPGGGILEGGKIGYGGGGVVGEGLMREVLVRGFGDVVVFGHCGWLSTDL